MRIPSSYHDRSDHEQMAMTPMIDIVFLLLIFFVCAAVGQIQESLLPTELSAGSIEAPDAVAVAKPLGEVWLRLFQNDQNQTIAEMNDLEYASFDNLRDTLKQLAETAPEIPVILDIGPDVPLGEMIKVYDTCDSANFETIEFAIDRDEVDTLKRKTS